MKFPCTASTRRPRAWPRRCDNWGQLVKFFKRKKWDVRAREWEQVSAMESGAAQELMDKIFKYLGGTLGTPMASFPNLQRSALR